MTKRHDIWTGKGERGLIIGQTGSGKSVMLLEQARQAQFAPVVVYDTKIDDEFLNLATDAETLELVENRGDFEKLANKPKRKQPDYIIVRPSAVEMMDYLEIDKYLLAQYDLMPQTYALVDEAYQIHKNSNCGPGLQSLLTRGRSRGISTILATQRPRRISVFCISEATRFYVYYLQDPTDRARVAEFTPYNKDKILDKHHFWYYKTGERSGTLFAPIPMRGNGTDNASQSDPESNQTIWL